MTRKSKKKRPPVARRIEPIAPLLAGVGAAAVALSLFLPLTQNPGTFTGVQDNTLVQHGGAISVLFAVASAIGIYRAFRSKSRQGGAMVGGLVTLAIFVFEGGSKGAQTLYPIGADGQPDPTQPGVHAGLGIAVYVGGLGAALIVVAGAMVAFSKPLGTQPVEGIKQCPDCAETVQAAARVCKHCGYRFEPA